MGAGLRRANAAARASRLEGDAARAYDAIGREWTPSNQVEQRLPAEMRPEIDKMLNQLLEKQLVQRRVEAATVSWRRHSGEP